MKPIQLTLRNIAGSPFRSGLVILCVALVAVFAVGATNVLQGAQQTMQMSMASMDNKDADILVYPSQSGFSKTGMEFMDFKGVLGEIGAVEGVAAVSPQIRLLTIIDSPLCQQSELYVVAIDPKTDFSVLPKLAGQEQNDLTLGKVIAGSMVSSTSGDQKISLAGTELSLVGQLTSTDSSLDNSLFVTFEMAQEMVRNPKNQGGSNLQIALDTIPVILVKTKPASDPRVVVQRILKKVAGVTAFESVNFFRVGRSQISVLLKNIPGLLGMIWILAVVTTGLVFSIAVNERRREIGVLRALGATRAFVLRSLLMEGLILALLGGVAGAVLSTLGLAFFRNELVHSTGLPLMPSSFLMQITLIAVIPALAALSVSLAALFPAWRISRQDPEIIMRR